MAATRIYILAKELGVKSKAIVEKCQNEGLDVKNHMSAISAGLAATIREWFSEGDNVTTVETAKRVDLKQVRVKKKKLAKPSQQAEAGLDESQADETDGDGAPEVAVLDAAEAPEDVAETLPPPVASESDTDTDLAAPVQIPATHTEEEPVAVPEVLPEKQEAPEPEKRRGPQIIDHPEPEPVVPAGPMLEKPKPAKLSGPQVVRVEAPEPLRPRRPRPRVQRGGPVTQPLMSRGATADTGAADAASAGKGKHAKGRHGRRRVETSTATTEAARKAKARLKWRQRDIEERQARLEAAGGEGLRGKRSRKIATGSSGAHVSSKAEKVVVTEPILVKDLSAALAVKAGDIITKLIAHGVMASANQVISGEMAELIALEYDVELVVEYKKAHEDQIKVEFENRERKQLQKRPVVATMLGHVDHGKTSLLDKIRSTQVAAGEAGGITQHIGASQVKLGEKVVSFLDTPGHEAFTAMRARGANMTDVVVLVVAADDGVMPQTIEAIAHSRAAEVPILVALNKIDLPGCDINRIYAQLAEHGLTPTEWGGETEVVKTSAQTGEGIEDLIEHIDFVAELLALEADDTIPAMGWVIEARMSPKRGAVATLLIKEGCLKKGDIVLSGGAYGRVKILKNSFGRSLKTATSSMPV